jgi:hypothetical protein
MNLSLHNLFILLLLSYLPLWYFYCTVFPRLFPTGISEEAEIDPNLRVGPSNHIGCRQTLVSGTCTGEQLGFYYFFTYTSASDCKDSKGHKMFSLLVLSCEGKSYDYTIKMY